MPKSPSQKLKLLYLKQIFEQLTDEEHPISVVEIIDKLSFFGVSAERKSIYDDIETLRLFGMDIIDKKGKSYGYYLASRDFELPELKLLVDATCCSRFITRKKSEELILKVENLTSKYAAQALQRQVFVANRAKAQNESIYYNIDAIHEAISLGTKISFKYFEWALGEGARPVRHYRREGACYFVSPWALTWDDEFYYLIAFEDKSEDIRHFRVDKMSEITCLEEPKQGVERFQSFDIGNYSRTMFDMFGGAECTVRIVFHNRLLGVVVDRFGSDIIISRVDDEHFSVSVRAAVSPPFLAWLTSFGADARVISPTEIVEKLEVLAQRVVDLYKTDKAGV